MLKHLNSGFTLIEMALVLLVLTLLLGGLLVPLGTQIEQRDIVATEKKLAEINEALVGYALAKGYLPCPDADNDGQEDTRNVTGGCPAQGNLPWLTLGIGETDAWGSRFIYRVTSEFSNGTTRFTLVSDGDIRICRTSEGGACAANSLLANDAPWVVLSRGKNRGLCGNPPAAANCVADEQENADSNDVFVTRVGSHQQAALGEFDDILAWLSPYVLKNRMVAAGKLPY